MANNRLPCLSKTSRPGDGDASTIIRPSAPYLTARSPDPTPEKTRLLAVQSPSLSAQALLAARVASRHKTTAPFDRWAFLCCMNPQITSDVSGLLHVAPRLALPASAARLLPLP